MIDDDMGSECMACGTPAPLDNVFWCDSLCHIIWLRRECDEWLSRYHQNEEARRLNVPDKIWRSSP